MCCDAMRIFQDIYYSMLLKKLKKKKKKKPEKIFEQRFFDNEHQFSEALQAVKNTVAQLKQEGYDVFYLNNSKPDEYSLEIEFLLNYSPVTPTTGAAKNMESKITVSDFLKNVEEYEKEYERVL